MVESPSHTDAYKKSHPHIHEVKYKDKNGKTRIYTYRYGEIKNKNPVSKVRNR